MTPFIEKLLYPTHLKRILFFILFDVLMIIISLVLSFLLRFDFSIEESSKLLILKSIPIFIAVKLLTLSYFRMYSVTWRYVGLKDNWNIIKAIIVSQITLVILINYLYPLPNSLQ
ncbi:MAG: polysaccharide biosynthesis protein, partial [Candidatus Kariarchaeaceae archaeon]